MEEWQEYYVVIRDWGKSSNPTKETDRSRARNPYELGIIKITNTIDVGRGQNSIGTSVVAWNENKKIHVL